MMPNLSYFFLKFGRFKKYDMKHIVLPDGKQHGLGFYLAMEEYVASVFDGEAFFVWRVSPTVIIGRNQVLENEVNMDYCSRNGVAVIRRKSGGGCVYSDMGNIMVSYVSARADVEEVFDRYLSRMTEALRSLGLPAVKSARNDILIDGRKVSGNALHQLPDRSIVHGTLLYSTDMDALMDAIRPPVEKLQRHGVESVRQRVVNVSDYRTLSPWLASPESLERYLTDFFTDGELRLSDEQVSVIEEMEKEYLIC